jgi:hypothetical protein
VEKVFRIKHHETSYAHQQLSVGLIRLFNLALVKFRCFRRTRGVNSAVTGRISSFANVGFFTQGINQYDMVILIRLAGKVAIAAFGASFFSCECPGVNRDFLAFAQLFQFVASSTLREFRRIIQTFDPPNASPDGLLIIRPNILSLV